MKIGDKVQVFTTTPGADIYWTASKNGSTPTVCGWKSAVKEKLVINFSSKTSSAVNISVFAAKDGMIHSELRWGLFSVGAADHDFSIGLGSSRVKFSERKEL